MTISEQLREHALYHQTGRFHEIRSGVAWARAFHFAALQGEPWSEPRATSIERRTLLLFIAEALE